MGATNRNAAGSATNRVCCKGKAQGFCLRESAGRQSAVLRLLADLFALASHCGINL
jgi:hypothetical protein